jgi:hypothetical protein
VSCNCSRPSSCGSSLCSRCSTFEVSTCTGRKHRASVLLGLRGTISAGVGWAAAAKSGVIPSPVAHLSYIGIPNELPYLRPNSNPKPCLIRIQSELGFQPLKCATLWVHAHIDTARVLLLGQ